MRVDLPNKALVKEGWVGKAKESREGGSVGRRQSQAHKSKACPALVASKILR